MNDLDLIAELMPEAPLPGPAELAPARDRLGAAITAEQAGERAYMGDRTWPDTNLKGCKDCQNMSKSSLSAYDGEALVKMAFVDRAGQLP